MFYCAMIISVCCTKFWASLVVQMVKNPPAMQEIWVQSLGWEYPLEEGMATHSSSLAWRIPWTEEPGGLQSMGCKSQTRLTWAESDMPERLSTHTKFMLSLTNNIVCSHRPPPHMSYSLTFHVGSQNKDWQHRLCTQTAAWLAVWVTMGDRLCNFDSLCV